MPSEALRLLNGPWGYTTRPTKKRAGKPLLSGGFYRMLANPFYCGLCRCEGSVYPGSHRPLMTRAEYEQVQAVLKRSGTGRPAPEPGTEGALLSPARNGRAGRRRHDHAFAGLMRCGQCQIGMVTATVSKGLVYYHCSNRNGVCTRRGVREEDIAAQIGAWVASVSFPPDLEGGLCALIDREIAERFGDLQRSEENMQQERDKRLVAARGRLTRLRGLVADGVLDADEYRTEKERTELDLARWKAGTGEPEWERVRAGAYHAVHTAATVMARFVQGSSADKRAVVRLIARARAGEGEHGPKLVLTGGKVLLEPHPDLLAFVAWNRRKARFKPVEIGSGKQKEPTKIGSVLCGGPPGKLSKLAKEIIRGVAGAHG